MKTHKNRNLAVIISILMILFAGMIIIAIPNQTIAAKADVNVSPFIGQDSSLTLSQKSSVINYPAGSTCVSMLTVFIPDINENASAWSNNYLKGGFSYNAEYLPEQIESAYSNAEIYSAFYEGSYLYITRIHNNSFPIEQSKIQNSEEVCV